MAPIIVCSIVCLFFTYFDIPNILSRSDIPGFFLSIPPRSDLLWAPPSDTTKDITTGIIVPLYAAIFSAVFSLFWWNIESCWITTTSIPAEIPLQPPNPPPMPDYPPPEPPAQQPLEQAASVSSYAPTLDNPQPSLWTRFNPLAAYIVGFVTAGQPAEVPVEVELEENVFTSAMT
ncbi:hypothetical protein B0T19DRAFT_474701 [Cercophora scortea]|uniref:Uncharacterized protein n=1 Tax=Cercophora scortea TaxID=314031 RepID=A0AAE0MK82_9PEZI|nr:hypothetical protein B0T19DRAFT_474701 [Cercophora scortea]